MKISSSPRLLIRLVISFMLPVMGVWVPFFHLHLLNGGNLMLPLQVHLPFLALLGLGVAAVGFLLQSIGPLRWRWTASALLLGLGIYFWAQGNLFLGNFGFLKGGDMDWKANQHLLYLEILLVAVLVLLAIRFRNKFVDQAGWIALILTISVAANLYPAIRAAQGRTSAMTKHTFTKEGLTSLSSKENVLLFIIDTFQSDVFAEIISEQPKWKEIFDGFTYFPNTTSAFPKTYASIPNLMTGESFDNSQPFPLYLRDAYLGKSAPKILKDNGFDVRYQSFTWQPYYPHPQVADNLSQIDSSTGRRWMQEKERVQLSNLVMFRMAPFAAKPWVFNDNEFRLHAPENLPSAEPDHKHLTDEARIYSQGNKNADLELHDELMALLTADSAKPTFRVFHFLGTHEPLNLDRDLNFIGKQSNNRVAYRQQAEGMLKLLSEELAKLREIGAYDNSLVFIVGDHGCGEHNGVEFHPELAVDLGIPVVALESDGTVDEEILRSASPLMLAKKIDHHGPLSVSKAPVEIGDFSNTVFHELGLAKAASGPSVFDIDESSSRERLHRHYRFAGWGQDYIVPLIEYRISGFSWDYDSWSLSGRDLNQVAVNSVDGQFVVFGQGGNLHQFEGEGWADPERQGRRIAGQAASLKIPVESHSVDLVLEIRFRPAWDLVTDHPISLFINGHPMAFWHLSKESSNQLDIRIPLHLVVERPVLDIRLEREDVDQMGPLFIEMRLKDATAFPVLSPGQMISFTQEGDPSPYLRDGWAGLESWGTWTWGHQSRLGLKIDPLDSGALLVNVQLRAAIFPGSPPLSVEVLTGGQVVAHWTFADAGSQGKSFTIPAGLVPSSGNLEMVFAIDNPRAPSKFIESTDPRLLGLGVETMVIQPNSSASANLIGDQNLPGRRSGLHQLEDWQGKPVGWSDGAAHFRWPAGADIPGGILVKVEAAATVNSRLVVLANGTPIGSVEVQPLPWSGLFDLSAWDRTQNLDLALFSTATAPQKGTGRWADPRPLGLALSQVEPIAPAYGEATVSEPAQVLDIGPGTASQWTGLYETESWEGQPTIWTSESAVCRTSWNHSDPPAYLLLETVGAAPGGSEVTILVNGKTVMENQPFDGHWGGLLDISRLRIKGPLEIEISCPGFVPALADPSVQDQRKLGIALRRFMLVE